MKTHTGTHRVRVRGLHDEDTQGLGVCLMKHTGLELGVCLMKTHKG